MLQYRFFRKDGDGQHEYEFKNEYAPENIKYMEWGIDVLDGDEHWICPECRTDSYLTDL